MLKSYIHKKSYNFYIVRWQKNEGINISYVDGRVVIEEILLDRKENWTVEIYRII